MGFAVSVLLSADFRQGFHCICMLVGFICPIYSGVSRASAARNPEETFLVLDLLGLGK